MSRELLRIEHVSVSYPGRQRKSPTVAVDDVSLTVGRGETVGLVGESGSGKTTLGRAVLGLSPVSRGIVYFDGDDITHADGRERRLLSQRIQMVFQDPYSTLNSMRTVGQTLVEPLLAHKNLVKGEAARMVRDMLMKVGLDADAADRYPSHFSGGQRQRIAVARALMLSPELVICDEPTSALDLSVQAQILNLLLTLQSDHQLSYLFVSHDLAVVRHMADRVVVLYRGQVMESGPADAVCNGPGHPYSQTLLGAVPAPDPTVRVVPPPAPHASLAGGSHTLTGCPFTRRCPLAIPLCAAERPALRPAPNGNLVACHRADEASTVAASAGAQA